MRESNTTSIAIGGRGLGDRTAQSERVVGVTLAILLGTFILYGVGFAGSSMLHNAAHDTRHSLSFPCH